jgi:large subunit ribosomal protein L17
MRHRLKKHHLGKPADQRKALLRTLSTSLFTYDEIQTTLIRAKALKEQADRIVSFAKRGDLHAIRQVSKLIYDNKLASTITEPDGRTITETVLRRIFRTVAPRFSERQGGYTRVIKMPPRRGDASPMALVQLTFELDHPAGRVAHHDQEEHEHHHEHGEHCNHEHHHHGETNVEEAPLAAAIDVEAEVTPAAAAPEVDAEEDKPSN